MSVKKKQVTYSLHINEGSLRFLNTGPGHFFAISGNGRQEHGRPQHQSYFSLGICRTIIMGVNIDLNIL